MRNNDAERAAIDAEISSLYDRIALLKGERNSLAPIFSLPNEVLIPIFGGVPETAYLFGKSILPLTKLMLVCRRWCNVLLGAHCLWGDITQHGRRSKLGFKAQLLRSGTAPLKIIITSFDSSLFGPLILANSDRLASLDAIGTQYHLLHFMRQMRDYKFPLLHSLMLSPSQKTCEGDAEIQGGDDSSLPSELFDGGMPRLSVLSLSNINAPWQSLPPLQSLSLRRETDSPTAPINLDILLGILRESPALHTLKLDMMLAPGIHPHYSPVDLLHLEFLHLREFLEVCEHLLTQLLVPATSRLELYPQGLSTGADVRDILISVRKHLREPRASIPLTLALHSPRDGSHFRIATYAEAITHVGFSRDTLFALNSHPAGAPALRQIMTKVLKAVPLQSLTTLDASNAHFTPVTWKAALALLPALEEVALDVDEAGTRFCEAALATGHPFRRIKLHSFARPGESEVVARFLDALTCLLQAHHRGGSQLQRLTVKDYTGTTDINGEKWTELSLLVDTLVSE
ncbi:hypothetical protein DFH06DRAFT_1470872 [Mycena polygramma]|nr:hypothetical protein DFH06DRAFT_1470872 [Mycena polygramma]